MRKNTSSGSFLWRGTRRLVDPMKNTTRFLLGLTSSLLLAAGLVHLAEKLDPTAAEARRTPQLKVTNMPPPCSLPTAEPEPRQSPQKSV